MDSDVRFKDRFEYWLDNQFSKGTGALIFWLAVLSLAVILAAALVVVLLGVAPGWEGGTPPSFGEAMWLSLMRTLDAGTMGADEGWGFRVVMFAVTLGGVFIISTLIGILSSAIEGKLEELRKGRSRVLESNHTVILGWSQQAFTVVSELVAANENQRKPVIVVMGDHDKVEMEDEIAAKVEDLKNTRLVCRKGSPMDLADLNLASLNTAKAIIVLSPESDDPDSEVIKAVLAITNHPRRRKERYHIVAEIMNPKNMESAKVVGKGEVEWVLVGDFVARVVAQTCRQSGLSVVYTELLDFGGDEIYFTEQAPLVGRTYGDSLLAFETNTVLGLLPAGGAAQLNPPMDTVLKPGDRLAVIAEDDDKIFLTLNAVPQIMKDTLVTHDGFERVPERTLLMGWNSRAATILRELDNYLPEGSETTILADDPDIETDLSRRCPEIHNQTVRIQPGETNDRSTLERLDLQRFDHIIVLAYSDQLTVQQADARTLITLLHLRDISEQKGCKFSIVSEMLDVRNRNLAEVTRADDFIVSDKLVSLMMAQVAENKDLNTLFADMFDPEGSEIYIKPVTRYVRTGVPVNFYTLVEAARRHGETAIGYRIKALGSDAEKAYGVRINPPKSEPVTFTEEDRLVVISED